MNLPLAVFGISFQSALWGGWVVLAILLSSALLFWLYRRLFLLYPRRQALTLVSLKIGAVALLLLSLLRPTWYQEERDLSHAHVILLVDDSQSMRIKDGALGQSRSEEARRIVFEKLLPKIKDRLRVTPFSFAETIAPLERPDQLTAGGEGTDIPNALLESVRHDAKSSDVGAFVLISDGGDARTLPPSFVPSAPVFALGLGSDLSATEDLSIEDVEYPERVDNKTDFEIKVEIAASGRAQFLDSLGAYKLSLSEGKNQINAQAVKLSSQIRKQILTFRVTASEPGIHRYTLNLPVLPDEIVASNNERTLTVEVQETSLRVLYYASQLGQGYKPLRNALKSDPGLQLTALVRVGTDRFMLQGEKAGDDFKNEFPTKAETLKKFKCVIIGDTSAKDLSPAALVALEQYVSNGGALVLLGGPLAYGLGGWDQSPLAPVFPWQIASSEPAWHSNTIAIELTPLAQANPIFKGIAVNLSAGSNAAKMNGYNLPGALRAGTQSLLVGILPSGERPALAALSRYGKGKVLGLATHALWLWSESDSKEAEGGKTYCAFWRQAVRFLSGGEDGGSLLKLSADRSGRYPVGSKATISAWVLDRNLNPLRSAAINASLKKLDGTLVGSVLFHEEGAAGSYSAQVDLGTAGSYRLQVSASDEKGVLETREMLLEAGSSKGEGAFPALNTSYLKELASRSGGALLKQDQVEEMVEKILDGVQTEVHRNEVSLIWDGPWYFLLFVGLMTCEWIVRRRMNMI